MQDWSLKRALPGHLHSQGSPWQRNLPQKQHQCPTVMSSLEPPPMNKASACFYSSFPLFLGQDIGLKGGLTATFLCTFLPVDNTLVTRKKTQVSSLVSCFAGHVEVSNYESLKMETSLGKDTTYGTHQVTTEPKIVKISPEPIWTIMDPFLH